MHGIGSNSALIKIVLILLILIVPQILRIMQQVKKSKSAPVPSRGTPLADALREALQKPRGQAGPHPGEVKMNVDALRANEQFQQPPKIEPESSFLPSALLLALLACLGVMAYRYLAG